jgi:hypothetical protein
MLQASPEHYFISKSAPTFCAYRFFASFILCSFLYTLSLASSQPLSPTTNRYIVTFFFVMATEIDISDVEDIASYINQLNGAERYTLHQREAAAKISGIPVFSGGVLTYSNTSGQIILPRTQPETQLILIITTRVSPAITHGNTITEWRTSPRYPTQWYQLTRTMVTKQKGMWTIRPIEDPPITIPKEAIVILAHPSQVSIPTGTSSTNGGEHLVLPHILVQQKALSPAIPTLNTVAINRFFTPLPDLAATTANKYLLIPF